MKLKGDCVVAREQANKCRKRILENKPNHKPHVLILLFYSKNGKVQKRGKINLVGRLQLSTEKSKEEDNEGIMQLRILRVQVHNTNMFMEMFYIYMLKINPDLLMIDSICVMLS